MRLPSREGLAALAALAAGLALAALPLTEAALVAAGVALSLAALGYPAVCLYLLAFAVPFGGLWTLSAGGLIVGGTEVLVGFLLATWLAQGVVRRELKISPGALFWPLALLLAAFLVSLFDALSLQASVKELAKWGEVAVVYVVGTSMLRNAREAKWMLAALLVAGTMEAASGVYGALMRLGPPSYAILGGLVYRASGEFAQPNPFGGYVNHVWPLALALLVATVLARRRGTSAALLPLSSRWCTSPWTSLLLAIALATMMAALTLSWSRGAWLGAGLALVVMAVAGTASLLVSVSEADRHTGRRAAGVLLVGAVLLAATGILGAADLLPSAITDRLGSIMEDVVVVQDVRTVKVTDENYAAVERVAHWWAGWRMWEEHPLTGVGLGNYAVAYPQYNLPGWEDPLGHAHNFYINLGAETGTIGLAAYLLFLAAAMVQAAVRLVSARGEWERGLALGVLGALIAHAVQDGLDNLWVHSLGVQVALLLVLLQASRTPAGIEPAAPPAARAIGVG